jgi:uncharacterized membrane protein
MTTSKISGKEISDSESIKGRDIRAGIFKLIQSKNPDFTADDYASLEEVNLYSKLFLIQLFTEEKGELESLDKDVLSAIRDNTLLSDTNESLLDTKLSAGQKVADKIAEFGGSWTFIISFFSFLMIWMLINIFIMVKKPFDPYPFILLNLILSCLAAIQAPIIMMSQNRQESKDRQRAELDYKVNLKAELEIKLLSEKMDYLLIHQNKKLLEIQEVQMEYLEGLIKKLKPNKELIFLSPNKCI